ncbi:MULTISPECIES: hypothetical protein [Vibrio]|uniref:Uncharacterized protein n=2 Tax=Vibrio genomosp. F10 TaxID=723171 RepID=A0A1B9R1S1_9VIBR|nr:MULTISPECIES: hypothetical protein [Vibrio]OCH78257.1 hypothetical protein A6E14_05420 [Vibrio genomosp. F10]OEE30896.1 hypothetical protein A1QO_15825 [Vibrio genomosp. F10 str. ZF-129]OEE92747.1 hypothetical protein A1QM_11640 [Vibrio genomosp. F10 str. 9ZC157]OEF01237.1 hypothetical protein A1QK_11270 [Vibrio genomosp. F10 str. 9ZD137]OEF05391.1 hypothetical protein A1QI_08500 [Vibrio genomosp. F10 str. 9ZB36]
MSFKRLKILIKQLMETEVSSPETQAARIYASGLSVELNWANDVSELDKNTFEYLYQSMPLNMIESVQYQLLQEQQFHLAEKWQKLISHLTLRHQQRLY